MGIVRSIAECKNVTLSNQKGFTLIEEMVGLLMTSILLVAVVNSFSSFSKVSNDQKLRTMTQMQAQSVVEMITPELRILGNGVPFHQSNFLIGQSGLSDNTVTQPILVSNTTASKVSFRINETGETYILTSNFIPSSSSVVTLTSTQKISVGDTFYITNSTIAGDDGLWSTVTAVNTSTNQVTMSTKIYKSGATFAQGSLLEVVRTVTYTGASSYGGITRNNGSGSVIVASDAELELDYQDASGSSLTLPLSAVMNPYPASAIQNVRSIKVTVRVRSPSTLSSGNYFIATSSQSVGIRNLNYDY